jgi:hypothetical protein
LAITSPTSSGRSVGIVRSLTQTKEFFYVMSVGLLARGISPSQGRYLRTEETRKEIHGSSGIRTHDPSLWTAQDSLSVRSRGPCERSFPHTRPGRFLADIFPFLSYHLISNRIIWRYVARARIAVVVS